MILLALILQTAVAQAPWVTFESGPVRPVGLSPDGATLFVANLPDGQLEVFDVAAGSLWHRGSVPVGTEPVAVGVRSNEEVWVVNHLSDSVSVVDVPSLSVQRTLLVGDAPRDIVFAAGRAFVTTAHRGQHRTHASLASVPGAGDPQLTTPGVGRADVWVFDTAAPGDALGGLPISVLSLFGDTPRALATDGHRVFAAVHHSGNRTTALSEGVICDGFAAAGPCTTLGGISVPGGNPGPSTNHDGERAPEVGLIVQHDGAAWRDELGRDWSSAVAFDLPDYDVFEIDAATLALGGRSTGVGTTLFNMAIHPISGALYITNTEANNLVRFEGPGVFGGSTVQGRLAEARVTIVDGGVVTPRPLNSHIDYSVRPAPSGTADHSLATPLDIAISSDGATAYVAAFGSNRIGVLSTADLEAGVFDPSVASAGYFVTGGGPAGLALDEAHDQIIVYTRFDHAVAVIDLSTGGELDRWALPDPEPSHVRDGRPFLYDARRTSSNGEASCAACHIFGDMDQLAWDLGNPDDEVTTGTIPIKLEIAAGGVNGTGEPSDFHPMKGPMTTQTLKGLQFSGAMHWRGDRSVGFYGDDPFDEALSFMNFVVAFEGLLGKADPLPESDMQAFTDFALTLALPPNPIRALDNRLTPGQQAALDFYQHPTRIADGSPIPNLGFNCDGCHTLDPSRGFFGTNGEQSFENEPQILKIPHLRNAWDKVGMFGMVAVPFIEPGDNGHLGEQVRGFGFLHDGSIDTLFRFFKATVFTQAGPTIGFRSDQERRDMESLMFAFDSDLAPVVGQQVTLDALAVPDRDARVDLLLAAAERPFLSALLGGATVECDVIAKAWDGTRVVGMVYEAGAFTPDDGAAPLTPDAVKAMHPVTFTAVLPGAGVRRGIDRDEDGVPDGLDSCSYIANATSQYLDCTDLMGTTPITDTSLLSDTGSVDTGVVATPTDTGMAGTTASSTGAGTSASTSAGPTGTGATGTGAAVGTGGAADTAVPGAGGEGCGCASPGQRPTLLLALLGSLVLVRRRGAASRRPGSRWSVRGGRRSGRRSSR